MSNRDDNHEDEEYYEDDSSSPVRSIFTLLVIGGFACYAAVTLPFGQKIVGPMDIPVISDMVHDKIGERLLKYTVDGQKFVNECGGSVATTTPYTFVSKPSAMPDGVSLVHIVIQKGQDRLQKSWAYNWQREQFEDWSLRLNKDVIYDGGVPSTVQGNLDMLTKMNIPELITFCGKK